MVWRRVAVAGLATVFGVGVRGFAQTHKVEKPEAVVRAVGVYEWTGDLLKPAASRLIPVSLYINGEMQDAAVYEPRPIPFALLPGNAYELQQAGVVKGLVELNSAGKLATTDSAYDDGWFGYGTFKPEAEVKAAQLKASRRVSTITTGKDDDKYGKGGGKDDDDANKVDPDRPTLRRRSPAGKNNKKADPAPTDTTTAGTPADDPDRPVLKKRGGKDVATDGADASAKQEIATGALNTDPDRPLLHRGKPVGGQRAADGEAMTKLSGLPAELHQMVAVSDAKNRAEHDFVRPWDDEAEHKAVLVLMEALAAGKLAAAPPTAGTSPAGASGTGVAGSAAKPVAKAAVPATPAARRRAALAAAAAKRKTAAAAKAAGPGLMEEDLRGYLLSYGGAPTFVYTAHTAGTGAALRYVTVVAQKDVFGNLQTAFSSVTDAAHLDRTPWMRLVGVVDAEASNRASLLFEMREQGSRQFALYRVLGSRSEAVFTTGTTQ